MIGKWWEVKSSNKQLKGGNGMFKRKKKNIFKLKINITNRNELDELLETIQKDIAALKKDFDKLNQFRLKFDLDQSQKNTSGN